MRHTDNTAEPGDARQHPLVALARLVVDGQITEAEAHARAETEHLLGGEELAAVANQLWTVTLHDAHMGCLCASVLHTWALSHLPQDRAALHLTGSIFVAAAIQALSERHDGRLYHRASAAAELTLEYASIEERGVALLNAGLLHLEPYALEPLQLEYAGTHHARQLDLRRALGFQPHGGWGNAMPTPAEALERAVGHLSQAAQALSGPMRGAALVHLAFAAHSRGAAGTEADRATLHAWCRQAAELLPPDKEAHASSRLLWLLLHLGDTELIARRLPVLVTPIDVLLRVNGIYWAVITYLTAAHVLLELGVPRGARFMLCTVLPVISDRRRYERRLLYARLAQLHCLPDDPTRCADHPARRAADTPEAPSSGPYLGTPEGMARAVHALLHLTEPDERGLLGVSRLIERASPTVVESLPLLDAMLRTQWASVYIERGAWPSAMRELIASAQQLLEIGYVAEASFRLSGLYQAMLIGLPRMSLEDNLDIILRFADFADDAYAWLDETAWELVTHCWTELCAALLAAENRTLLPVFMSAAKGRAFGAALAFFGPDVHEPADDDLLAAAADIEKTLDPAGYLEDETARILSATEFGDAEGSLGAYLHRTEAEPGRTPAERMRNLRRRFQQRSTRRLLSKAAQHPPLRSSMDIQSTLANDIVLVSLYFGVVDIAGQGRTAGYYATIYTTDLVDVFAVADSAPAFHFALHAHGGQDDDRFLQFDSFGWVVGRLRRRLAEDPLHRMVSRSAHDELEDLRHYFAPLWERVLVHAGPQHRRLVIWPHRSTYLMPFPALPLDDGLLADRFLVTLMPSIEALFRNPPSEQSCGVAAVGCGDGGTVHGLPTEPALDRQAACVAAHFGLNPVAGPEATPGKMTKLAGRNRYLHIAAHGAMDPVAPTFACLFLAADDADPGGADRLFAHDILQWDLRNVDLVTLSACESALLRYDFMDNLQGLAPAFLRAGARAVVAALWPVTAEVADTFFGSLYAALAADPDRFAAFQTAQSAARAKHPQVRDWAAFVFLGH